MAGGEKKTNGGDPSYEGLGERMREEANKEKPLTEGEIEEQIEKVISYFPKEEEDKDDETPKE